MMPNPTNGQLRPTTANGPHRQTLAVIGNGMASARLVDDLLERGADQRWHIHVFGEERHSAYNRILLGRVLNGADPGDISLRPAGWHSDAVHHHLGGKVTHLDPLRRQLTLADGTDHRFDAAVLATGSTPFVPPIDGSDKPGVVVYRTLDDVATMRRASVSARSAVVVGGGLLGLEAAKALLDLGLHVTVVHLAGHLMDTQLDAEAGTMLRRRLEQTGLFIRTGVSVQTIHGDPDVDQVTLTDGEVLPADLVVMACGIRPRVDLAKAAGLPTNRAVLVNDRLATAVPGIFAVGECAEHRGKTYGLVAPIWEQTAVLADLLTATDTQRRYTGSKLHAKLKVAGVEVASMGRCNIVDDHDRAITVNEPDRNVSRKLIVRNGKLVGAQFVGETAAAAKCIRHFVDETPLPTDPLAVLVNPSCLAGGADPDPEICNCNKVNRSVILTAIGNGATDVEAVGQCTKAGTGCGSCRTAIAALLPQPAPVPT